jgi:hypothetical protein
MPAAKSFSAAPIPGSCASTRAGNRPPASSSINKTVQGARPLAEAELARLLSQLPPRPQASSTLDEYLDWWRYVAVDGRLCEKTAGNYTTLFARHIRPEHGALKLSRLKPLDLQSLLVSLTNRGLFRSYRSPRTPSSEVRFTRRGAGNQQPRIQPTTCRCPTPTNANSVSCEDPAGPIVPGKRKYIGNRVRLIACSLRRRSQVRD